MITSHCATSSTTGDQWQAELRPATFADYVGQGAVIDGLRKSVLAACRGGWTLDHFLFSGPPGVGKTSLAYVIANELNQRLVVSSGPSISHRGDLAALLASIGPGDVLFIDEIHRLPTPLQETLYTAMEDFRVTLSSRANGNSASITIPLPRFTLLGATTDAGMLAAPFLDRFGFHWRLRHHEISELTRIVARSATLSGIEIDHSGCLEIASRARGTPRTANRLLRRVRDFAIAADETGLRRLRQTSSHTAINGQLVGDALSQLSIDCAGLDPIDRQYLKALASRDGRAVGIEAIAAAIQAPQSTVEQLVEPFLLQIGFVARTGYGRVLTDSGRRHLDLVSGSELLALAG